MGLAQDRITMPIPAVMGLAQARIYLGLAQDRITMPIPAARVWLFVKEKTRCESKLAKARI